MNSKIDLSELAVERGRPADGAIDSPAPVFSRYVLPLLLLAGFAVVAGWALRDAFLPRRPVTVAPVLVSLADVQQAGTPLFKAGGWVEPRPTAIRVAALAPGVIERLLVVEDQPVKQGEPIAHLVDEDARLALESAGANLKLREAELDQAKAALQAAQTNFDIPTHLEVPAAEAAATLARIETEIANLPFEIERADARHQLAEIDFNGKDKAGEAVSRLAVDQARSELTTARAALEELRQRLPLLKHERAAQVRKRDAAEKRLELKTDEKQAFDAATAQLAAAQAQVRQAAVAVDQAQLRLDRMVVRAPVDGRVLHLLTTPGIHVSGGMGPEGEHTGGVVVSLYQPDRLQVRVDVRFEDLPRVGRDQPVLIESPALSAPLEGRVLFPTSLADIQKNTLEVKVTIEEPPEVLKPEMLVDVTFQAPELPTEDEPASDDFRLFVPKSLVEQTEDGTFVWLADVATGVARRQPIKTGLIQSKTMVEVVDGLNVSSRLISQGRESLRDGDRIKVTGEDAAIGVGDGEGERG